MNYDAEIARLVDAYSTKCAKLTGKPEHRKQGAQRLLVELADAIKKLVREDTLNFYEGGRKTQVKENLGPLFAPPAQPYVPPPIPGAVPPVRGVGVQPTSLPQS